MNNHIGIFLLAVATLACHKTQPIPDEPDLATNLAGNWRVEDCRTLSNIPGACTGSLVLTRIDATHLSGDFKLSTGSPFTSICQLYFTDKDTLFGVQAGGSGYYKKGQIQLAIGDATMNLRFAKD